MSDFFQCELCVLQLMRSEDAWSRETDVRKMHGATRIALHVLEILDSHVDANAAKSAHTRPFLIVMPAAEQDLTDFLVHDRIAGNSLEAVVNIVRQVAEHTQYLHKCNQIHGDLKPRNICRVDKRWYLAFFLCLEVHYACSEPTRSRLRAEQSGVALEASCLWAPSTLCLAGRKLGLGDR